MSENPPKVFVSYSHDSAEHKQWVLEFATLLRTRGIDAVLDAWGLEPGDDLPHFMETEIADCDYAVMICTPVYVEKANAEPVVLAMKNDNDLPRFESHR